MTQRLLSAFPLSLFLLGIWGLLVACSTRHFSITSSASFND